ncbi:MAG: TRAP transporter large permease subunit [Proteobacteria bacterium]|nr:TRAP transporter large permease subunit [Pseudomonadota bacterium]
MSKIPLLNQGMLFTRDRIYMPVEWVWTQFWWLIGFIILQVIFAIVLSISYALILIRAVYRVVDRGIFAVEQFFLVAALVGMTGLVFIVALDRWFEFINLGWFWATKLALFLMIWVGFIGASLATKKRKHLAIDIAGRVLNPRGQRIAAFFSQAIAAGFCFVAASYAYDLVLESHEFGDREGVLPIPTWIIQSIMPFTLIVMGARFIENIFKPPPEEEELEEEGKRPRPQVVASTQGQSMALKDVILAGLFPGFLITALIVFKLGTSPGWLILIGCVIMLIMGQRLFVLIGLAVFFCTLLFGSGELINVPVDMFGAVKKEVLMAIPFFILAGSIMTAGSIAERLIDFAKSVVWFMPGGLLIATIISCLFFAAISGSAPVTVIAIGTIMFPALLKEGFDEDRSLGLVTTAGTLGILIPPSIPMIIYAIMAPVGGRALSIRELFIAGVLPGLLVALVLAGYSIFKMDRKKFLEIPAKENRNLLKNLKDGVFSLVLILIIFAGIYLGWFTVTEASAVAVLYALAVELLVHRELKVKDIAKVFIDSSWMMGTIFILIVFAIAFNKFLAEEQIPQEAAAWLKSIVESKIGFLLMTNIFLLLLGCLMDIMSAIMIIAPLLAPIAISFGIDPIHFGLIFIVNLSIGYITPPIGLNLFVASSVLEKPIVQVIRASFPYAVIMLLALIAVTYIPWLSLFLLGR